MMARLKTAHDRAGSWPRRLLALFLSLHGVAHLVGTDTAFQALKQQTVLVYLVEQETTVDYLLGHWQVGQQAILLLIGASWTAVAVGFLMAARWLWHLRPGWWVRLVSVTAASLVLTVIALPQAWIGVLIDVSLLAGLFWTGSFAGRWKETTRLRSAEFRYRRGDMVESGTPR
jgi:hypothetical protein